jgi:hypothetical protein
MPQEAAGDDLSRPLHRMAGESPALVNKQPKDIYAQYSANTAVLPALSCPLDAATF